MKGGVTPLIEAVSKGHKSIVEYLLEKGANVDLPAYQVQVEILLLLMIYFFFRFFFIISFFLIFLLKGGATPLFVAAERRHIQIVQLLLEKGANINLPIEVFFLEFYICFYHLLIGTPPIVFVCSIEKSYLSKK